MKEFILIDGSYFCFYRFFAIKMWYKSSHDGESLDNPIENEEFVEKYCKTFQDSIKKLVKLYSIDKTSKPIIIVGKDCKHKENWRHKYIENYKGTRETDSSFSGDFIKMAYEEKELFKNAGAQYILKQSNLEADDCLAIASKYLSEKYKEEVKITIITSDMDYLQLVRPNISIFTLKK